MEIPTWLALAVSAAYSTNVIIGALGYIPQLTALWWAYRQGKQSAVSVKAYALWSFGALNTVLFGLLVVRSPEMMLVGGTTLLLNLSVIVLVKLSHSQTKR